MGEVNVFLSYRREDTEGYAGRLFDRLNARFPKRVFKDVDSILAGANFVHELEKSIKASDALVALIGRQWLTSSVSGQRRIDDSRDFVRLELEIALSNGVRIIPALVGGAAIPRAQDLPDSLRAITTRQAIELGHRTFDRDVERLVRELSEIGLAVARERREKAAAEKRRLKESELLRGFGVSRRACSKNGTDRRKGDSSASKGFFAQRNGHLQQSA